MTRHKEDNKPTHFHSSFPLWIFLIKQMPVIFCIQTLKKLIVFFSFSPYYNSMTAYHIRNHRFFPLDNEKAIKRSLRKMQDSLIISQWITYQNNYLLAVKGARWYLKPFKHNYMWLLHHNCIIVHTWSIQVLMSVFMRARKWVRNHEMLS